MNGIHDMGGMEGLGPLQYEQNEPVFHEPWEAKALALNLATRALGKWNIDAGRYAIEVIPAEEYLRTSYYEKWTIRLEALLISTGLVTRDEILTGCRAPGTPKAKPSFTVEAAERRLKGGAPVNRTDGQPPRFVVGDDVRARNINPAGHTRLPRYARGKVGWIAKDHGVFVFPDTNAHGLGENPQHVYSVRFMAQELWGESASPRDSVFIDLWDRHLDHA